MSFSQGAVEAEASTRALLEKAAAAKHREPHGALRKDVLRRLTTLSKSPHASVKRLVAENLRYFFRDFPALEDEVINAVYDICEDGDQTVRIAGYRAIVELSREDHKWTKRNTDVLLQLLQSDDAVELEVITHALIDHIHIDAAAALSVMCDHAAADLRKLVVEFFLHQGKEPIEGHMRGGPQSEAQAVFRDGLLRILPKSTPQEAVQITEQLLLPLSSFAPGQPYRNQLLEVLIEHCKNALKTDVRAKNPLTLPTTLPLLECASKVPGVPLMRFNATFVLTKATLTRLTPEVQLKVLEYHIAAVTAPKIPVAERDEALNNTGFIIETLARAHGSELWTVVEKLANAFISRGTACPPPLVPAWRMLQQQAEMEPRNVAGDALHLIKSVLNPPLVPPPGLNRSSSTGIKRKATEPASAPAPRGPGGLFAKAMQDAVPGSDDRLSKRMRVDSAPSAHVKERTPPPAPLVARIQIDRQDGARSAPPSLLKRMLDSTPTPVSPVPPVAKGNGHWRGGGISSPSLSARIAGGRGGARGARGGGGAPSLLHRLSNGGDSMDVDRPRAPARRMRVYNAAGARR
ncbi:hypothetical protein AURDEDRAFT_154207 [Auricularia subglabra TFB-10046 SS5]|uniref:ARM repeat-containing protein n=1 Tax=Auricularia subglabra (strain TFB-10046 / SS5) TaxID=717982 RepID=J0WWQ4_AURST|nr:hypothetical protein AURDEDRAFT_154207 [Auricularia subglabra TFB-10046 SS5]